MRARHEILPSQEELLVDFARRLQRHRTGRVALWLHLSRLQRDNRHANDIRLAANLLRPLALTFLGEVFVLGSGDVVLCLKDPSQPKIDSALFQVRYSFGHDPLMRQADEDGDVCFVTRYEIADDYEAFSEQCDLALAASTSLREVAEQPHAMPTVAAHTELAPADSGGLGPRLILSRGEAASGVSLSESHSPAHPAIPIGDSSVPIGRLSRHDPIVALGTTGAMQPIGSKLSVPRKAVECFGALNLALARGQICARTALGEVERRVAPELARVLSSSGQSLGVLSLRLETAMTPEFAEVVSVLEEPSETDIWVAFEAEDVRDDPDTAAYIRGFLQRKGIPVGVSGLSPAIAKSIVRFLAGLSFAEIVPTGSGALPGQYVSGLVRLLDADNILVSGTASPAARKDAISHGARRFVGPSL